MSDASTSPIDWQTTNLGALAEYVNGYPFKPKDWTTSGLPIVRIAQMTDPNVSCDYYDNPLPSEYCINNGDLLFSWSATLMALVWQRGPAYLNQHIYKVVPKNNNNISFLHHLLNRMVEPMANQSHGTTMKHITRGDLLPFPVTVPMPEEQSRIAMVLDIVDDAIAGTEAVILKLKNIRAGMLHDLLIRGVDKNGQLRPLPSEASTLYKDSLLGKIPKEWEFAPLKYFLTSAEYGISSSLSDKGEIPVLRMNNFANGEAFLSDIKYSPTKVQNNLLLRDGDVLFNRTNSYVHVGRTGIWRCQLQKATFASYLVRLNPNLNRIYSEYLNLLLNMPESQIRMRQYATPAVQQVNINPTSLQQMLVAVPKSIEEQKRVVSYLNKFDQSINAEKYGLDKLLAIKSGLMSDLMTGKVRVPENIKRGKLNV